MENKSAKPGAYFSLLKTTQIADLWNYTKHMCWLLSLVLIKRHEIYRGLLAKTRFEAIFLNVK